MEAGAILIVIGSVTICGTLLFAILIMGPIKEGNSSKWVPLKAHPSKLMIDLSVFAESIERNTLALVPIGLGALFMIVGAFLLVRSL